MNIIFLDIDGVITSARTGWMNWDIYAVTFLKWICEKANIQIVISSSWRHNHNKQFFVDIFGNIIHKDWKIPTFISAIRGKEIQQWLDNHPEVQTYLIIDDDSDMLPDQPLLLTSTYDGLSFDNQNFIRDYFDCNEPCNMNLQNIVQHSNMFAK